MPRDGTTLAHLRNTCISIDLVAATASCAYHILSAYSFQPVLSCSGSTVASEEHIHKVVSRASLSSLSSRLHCNRSLFCSFRLAVEHGNTNILQEVHTIVSAWSARAVREGGLLREYPYAMCARCVCMIVSVYLPSSSSSFATTRRAYE
jgi:hypothetical protein